MMFNTFGCLEALLKNFVGVRCDDQFLVGLDHHGSCPGIGFGDDLILALDPVVGGFVEIQAQVLHVRVQRFRRNLRLLPVEVPGAIRTGRHTAAAAHAPLLEEAGDYTIVIADFAGDGGTYTLTVEAAE